jgi:hypothetical protein
LTIFPASAGDPQAVCDLVSGWRKVHPAATSTDAPAQLCTGAFLNALATSFGSRPAG